MSESVKRFLLITATLFVLILVMPALPAALVGFLCFGLDSSPPQPKFGFKGQWRSLSVIDSNEERRLPQAAQIWQDYSQWKSGTKDGKTGKFRRLFYIARLGGAERQSAFHTSISKGETPMGAQWYTHVDFTYTDPTNGTYRLTWSLRGKHDTRFLKFDNTYRYYQLELCGATDAQPPTLAIVGIEGINPEQ